MDSTDQRRKRKRILRQSSSSSSYYYSPLRFLSVRSLLTCCILITLLYLYKTPFSNSIFRPVLIVPSLSLLSSSTSRTVKSVRVFGTNLFSPSKIVNRVFFPDHVLLLLSGGGGVLKKVRDGEMECVYYDGKFGNFEKKKVISADEFDGLRSIVRCPLPSMNHSDVVVSLEKKLGKNGIFGGKNGISVKSHSWENLVYEAVLDGDSVVVFVKGLNLRAGRESDPSPYSCHFGQNGNNNDSYTLSTRALTAAQEVVRCSLPQKIDDVRGIRVTVGSMPRVRSRSRDRVLAPSVAEIIDLRSEGRDGTEKKYELCVCTMVWNQASAIREWIMYHSWLGVEKWFVYDNNSDDGIEEVVRVLNLENYDVTRRVWPWIKTQEAGFSHCALRSRYECEWVSFIDVDEYFYFPYSTALGHARRDSLRALVSNFSSSSRNIGEIRTSCHSFGPSGLNSRPARGVTVGYACRLRSPERHKSIVRPDALDPTLLNAVHHFKLRRGFDYVNLPGGTAAINHYKYQAWEVFRAKFFRRVATYVADWRENQNEGSRDRAPGLGTEAIEPRDWSKRFCEVWDTGLRDYVLANLADGSTGLLPWETGFDSSG